VNWNFFLTELVNGLTLGSVYALLALGYSMVYGILKLLNFAHGDVYMVGAFIGYGVETAFGGPLSASIPLVPLLILMFLAAMLGAGLLGVAIERFAYRRLRNAPRIAPLITALGVSFLLENTMQLLFGAQFRQVDPFDLKGGALINNGIHLPAGTYVAAARVLVIVGTAVLMVVLTLLVSRTQVGKAMRATSFDREAAAMMGIDIDRVIVFTFFVGSALAGAAGVMITLVLSQVWFFMGFAAGLKAFTAAVVGGIGNIPGAMLGGIVIGLAEAFSTGYVSSTFQDAIVFCVLIAVMIVRPSGLLGRAAVQKV
jgi:branched-chain amino acid transport system permease protein